MGTERGIKSDKVQETLLFCGLDAPVLLPALGPAVGGHEKPVSPLGCARRPTPQQVPWSRATR